MIESLLALLLCSALGQQSSQPPLELPMTIPGTPTPPVQTVKPIPYQELNAFSLGDGRYQALLILHGVISKLPSTDISPKSNLVKWDTLQMNVFERRIEDNLYRFETELTGKADPKQSLLINYRPVKVESDGSFKFNLTVSQAITELLISRIQSDGIIEVDPYAFTVTDWNLNQGRENMIDNTIPQRLFFSPGLALSSVSYNRSNSDLGTLSPILFTLKLGLDYRLKHNWDLEFKGFTHLIPLSGSTASTSFKWVGIQFRGGKKIDWLPPPWELKLSVGLNYLTMLTSGNFGFAAVLGPELSPSVSYSFNNGGRLLSIVKFSSISQGISLPNFANSELGMGLQYQFPTLTKISYSLGIDISSIALTAADQNNVTGTVASTSVSVGGAISF